MKRVQTEDDKMGLIKNIRTGRELAKRNISINQLDQWIDQQFGGGGKTFTGVNVTTENALKYSAKWNSTAILSQTIASLPLIIYKKSANGNKKRATDHQLFDILHNQPNPEMTSFTWREMAMVHMLTWGNHYSKIEFDGMGWNIKGLWPLDPSRVKMDRSDRGQIIYRFRQLDGTERIYKDWEIFHVPGMGFNGRLGYNILNKSVESLGLGLALEEYGARWFDADSTPGGILEAPNRLSDPARENLKKSWKAIHGSLAGKHQLGVLEEGMKYNDTSKNPEESQALQSRKFQVTEEARWSGLPPHKLKDLEKATFSNIEEQQIEFVMDSIRLWVTRWEQVIDWKLLRKDERQTYFSEFLIEGLLRGDIEKRYKAYATGKQWGFLNSDEIRRMENMNPTKDGSGKIYWGPLNYKDASKMDEVDKPSQDNFQGDKKEIEEEKDEKKDEKKEEKMLETILEMRGKKPEAIRSVLLRQRIAESYKQLFRGATIRILMKERKAVEKIAKKAFEGRTIVNFNNEIDDWYLSEDTRDFVEKEFAKIYKSYAVEIYSEASKEVNNTEAMPATYEREVDRFIENTTTKYILSSRGQLKSVARIAEESEENSFDAIMQRIADWEEKRPDKVAGIETIAGMAGLSAFVYFSSGFRTEWVTVGKSCPYCDSLDGMIISQGDNFLSAGTVLEPDGAIHGPMTITRNISHPPAHNGCDCSVIST